MAWPADLLSVSVNAVAGNPADKPAAAVIPLGIYARFLRYEGNDFA